MPTLFGSFRLPCFYTNELKSTYNQIFIIKLSHNYLKFHIAKIAFFLDSRNNNYIFYDKSSPLAHLTAFYCILRIP